MSVITVCKNVIMANNKREWVDPKPPIRVATTSGGGPKDHVFNLYIVDKDDEVVAELITTHDGKPIVKCGAKVAIFTKYQVVLGETEGAQ